MHHVDKYLCSLHEPIRAVYGTDNEDRRVMIYIPNEISQQWMYSALTAAQQCKHPNCYKRDINVTADILVYKLSGAWVQEIVKDDLAYVYFDVVHQHLYTIKD